MTEISPENTFQKLEEELGAILQEGMIEGSIQGEKCIIAFSPDTKFHSFSIVNEDGSEILFLINIERQTIDKHKIDKKRHGGSLKPKKLSPEQKVDLVDEVRNLLAQFNKQ